MTTLDLKSEIQRGLDYYINGEYAHAFPGGTVVAAVSGGPDSMAMFHALCELARERGDIRVVAAHYDHRLRPGSERDVDVIRRVADEHRARVVAGSGDVGRHAHTFRQSVEAAARELRYRFLRETAEAENSDEVLTAHTRDDQIETIVMRIIRGTGLRGLRGISPRWDKITRPLLGVTHEETVHYCEQHRVPYLLDPSNDDTRFFRNRIRHEILPALRRDYPGIDAMLENLSSSARIVFDEAWLAVHERAGELRRENDIWVLPYSAFDGLSSLHCVTLMMRVLDLIGVRENVTRTHMGALLGLVYARRSGMSAGLPHIRVRREHDGLVFENPADALPQSELSRALQAPGVVDVDGWRLEAHRIETPPAADFSNSGRDVAYIPCNDTMVVRYPREGDRMQPFGMDGHKKLSDVFIDRKIPRRVRAATPVVEVDGEIVWVVGVATSERCRIDQKARSVVKLTARRSQPS